MGTWSEEFNNIPRAAAHEGRDIAEFMQSRIDQYARDPSLPGEIFYFPPGDHLLALGPGRTMDIPEQIEVMFAPGARLVVAGDGSKLVIRGTLSAPVGPIFATAATVDTSSLPGPLALVIPFGPRIERIHPEWWGAGSLAARVPDTLEPGERERIAEADTGALQMAFLAAVFGEALAPSATTSSLSVPVVELLGTYLVKRPIYLGSSAAFGVSSQTALTLRPSSLEVRGRFCDPEQVTLWCASSFDVAEGPSMFVVGDLPGLHMRCVSFESSEAETACVGAFAVVTSAPGSTRLPYVFQHCRFRSRGGLERRRVALVRLDVLGASTEAAAPAVEFEGCVFEPSPTLGAAVRLSSLNRISGATFRGCTFAGHAMAMIDAIGVSVTTTGCRFQNQAIPPRLRSAARPLHDADFADMHEVAPEGGIDVYLRQNPLDMDPTPPATRPPPDSSNGAPDPLAPASVFSSQDCRSTSPQFLVAPLALGRDRLMRPSTVIGLHHGFQFDPATSIPAGSRPPAIHWKAMRGIRPVALHLIGCRFDGISENGASRLLAPQTLGPAFFDYGILAGDREPVSMTSDLSGRVATVGMLPFGLFVGSAPPEER